MRTPLTLTIYGYKLFIYYRHYFKMTIIKMFIFTISLQN